MSDQDHIPVFTSFAQIVDPALYQPLPDGWVIGVADVVMSTSAIEAGRYKAVNMAGAAVISAVSNALGQSGFPFAFGGDGASFAVGPDREAAAREALAATATFAKEELDLDLRVGAVPVSAIREAGVDVRVARFAASPSVAYAMFSGGGVAWAEARLKVGEFQIAPAPPGTRPDLSGLSCRFEPIQARHGLILSLIVRPIGGIDARGYRQAVEDLLASIEASTGEAKPVPEGGPAIGWPSPGFGYEVKARHKPGTWLPLTRARVAIRTAFAAIVFKLGLPVGAFDPKRYMSQLVANSDYRKYDDALRMTIDCSADLADEIEARLTRGAEDGTLSFGLHRQSAAIMTCFTPSAQRDDHVHFVDGASGGYAAAAAGLKGAIRP